MSIYESLFYYTARFTEYELGQKVPDYFVSILDLDNGSYFESPKDKLMIGNHILRSKVYFGKNNIITTIAIQGYYDTYGLIIGRITMHHGMPKMPDEKSLKLVWDDAHTQVELTNYGLDWIVYYKLKDHSNHSTFPFLSK